MVAEHHCFSSLKLVYPPVSDQEATWVEHDPEVEARIRQSDFYMIGARQEITFANPRDYRDTRSLTFDLFLGDRLADTVTIVLDDLLSISENPLGDLWMDWGQKVVKIWAREEQEEADLLDWFTTEKLIWERSRNAPGIVGLNNYRDLATYDLPYVGIAKVGDTFERLFKKAHKKRANVLSNELQRKAGARVSDEICIFAFGLDIYTATMLPIAESANASELYTIDPKRVVADAEKAFVSLLRPEYNEVKFKKYPRGDDGLYDSGLAGYVYCISENITFCTPSGTIFGSADESGFAFEADVILVSGDQVEVVQGGRLERG